MRHMLDIEWLHLADGYMICEKFLLLESRLYRLARDGRGYYIIQ